ncbi:MAG: sigma-54-dependent Fis family transcriptional regulator [Chloroflexaceae bacterium]|nr:sigma-54-dependent Fis family transcriptional regulator [Chloroflexaceae bacterium]
MNDILQDSTILVADDDPALCGLVQEMLIDSGANVIIAHSGPHAIDTLESMVFDAALLDVHMPEPGGLAILQYLSEQQSDLPVLIVTGYSSAHTAMTSTSYGAYDYLPKPLTPDRLLPALRQAIAQYRTRQQTPLVMQRHATDPRDTLIGQSEAMQQVYKLIGRVASSDATVLITGESGTGKELVARTLHQMSERNARPFITVNCAALTETLLESELFGHEKGAFTGAMARRKGRFEQASGGTIFLDEMGEMSPAMQKKLLRVLQERSIERVGGNASIAVDVRVLAATNRHLQHEVQAGRFRDDLYYRLCVITLQMPPLRERIDDISLLVAHFLMRYQQRHQRQGIRLSEAALVQLQRYHWPGNVRQLENVIERAVILTGSGLILPEHLLLDHEPPDTPFAQSVRALVRAGTTMTELVQRTERTAWQMALQQCDGNREAAAQLLALAQPLWQDDEPHV